ncbi:TIM barrel protein [Haladaptatus sp. T7]|uniref:hydroxypyruvate isomerase family protein n=1 Tax=Haladaptatus sp. T7 TaxID=2029368 RepID=UPI0021A25402|nr:TIM barrel protein [Haladaptatus sp. T7]GKZ14497.1 hydroxypyruvate isomerase [Haladaptatus sp. T7]
MPELSVCVEMVFKGAPFTERIGLAAAAGADAVEFWGWRDKDLDAVANACDEHGLNVAAMLGSDVPLTDPNRTSEARRSMRESIETAARLGCPTLIITVGQEQEDIDHSTQRGAIVGALESVAPDATDAGVTLAVEPLNTAVDHPGYFLESSAEGYDIVDTVGDSNVKLLFDVYHQQITEGNVIANMTSHLDHIGYVHIADVPGRHEPGTGELDYENILPALAAAGYDGYIGCEFSPEGDDTAAVSDCRAILNG